MKPYITLGIETSCDETGAAVYHQEKGLLSNALFSQIELHRHVGGVIPEIASQSQLEKITPIVHEALDRAQLTIDTINVIAVTNRPGLPGSLLVGVCFAKALAFAQDTKLIGINHLEGHAFSAFLSHPHIPFPHVCITASGGHTSLYLIRGFGDYTILGQTVDDAAGEAFDKIAKLLGLPYPGGPEIEKRAQRVQFQDFFHYPRAHAQDFNFSFSGLKTAVLYDLIKRGAYDLQTKTLLTNDETFKNQVASSLLVCIADIFTERLQKAIKAHSYVNAVTFVGGVACNQYIRKRLAEFLTRYDLPLFVPTPQFCTDNGAMIAFVGNYKAEQEKFSGLELDILT